MRSNFLISLVLLPATALIAACTGNAQEHMGFPPPAVSTVEVQPHPVPVEREYVGRTMGYQEGSAVAAGDPLFKLDRLPFEARVNAASADLARAEAEHARATREYQRLVPLAAAEAVSAKELDDARSDEELAAAAVLQAKAALQDAEIQLSYTTVKAPISAITGIAEKFEGARSPPARTAA